MIEGIVKRAYLNCRIKSCINDSLFDDLDICFVVDEMFCKIDDYLFFCMHHQPQFI